jgi:hypothetical protein
MRGAKRIRPFCHCEPVRQSGQAWQSLFMCINLNFLHIEIAETHRSGIGLQMTGNYEIATASLAGSLAMTEGVRLPRPPSAGSR